MLSKSGLTFMNFSRYTVAQIHTVIVRITNTGTLYSSFTCVGKKVKFYSSNGQNNTSFKLSFQQDLLRAAQAEVWVGLDRPEVEMRRCMCF